MVIRHSCERWTHQFQWTVESHGVSYWVCTVCGEYKQQNEDLGSGA